MARFLAMYAALMFVLVALLALSGTNAQARLARANLLADPDEGIAEAGRAWTPVRWVASREKRRVRLQLEAELKSDPEKWARYTRLTAELRAWNALETSVALALPASVAAVIAGLLAT